MAFIRIYAGMQIIIWVPSVADGRTAEVTVGVGDETTAKTNIKVTAAGARTDCDVTTAGAMAGTKADNEAHAAGAEASNVGTRAAARLAFGIETG